MKLQFRQIHLSISQFNEVDLEDFTVLTGVNGSGKSHLMEAIELKKVVIEGMENANIVRFNFETFKLENEGAYNAQQISAEREAAWTYFDQQIKPNIESWKVGIGDEYKALSTTCGESKKSLWSVTNSEPLKSYKQNVKNYFAQPNVKQNESANGIYSLLKNLPYSIDEIKRENFIKLYKPFTYKADFLPQALGKIVWDYYVKYRNNQINDFENEKHGKNYPVLNEDEFISAHGEKPWEVINKILEKFDSLEYKVTSPEGADYFGNFQLKLVHTKKRLEIDFGSLSSGERVLMALVASVYKASSDNYFPDILLLDELDASLHPSMMKNMLAVIKDIFLDKNIKVILVTHSPTTIALSPEESIFVMNKEGVARIAKKSRREALSILTEGFATLDEGIIIFDEVLKNAISIFTEGRNIEIIQKACDLFGHSDIKIIRGVEGVSGKNQLKTLFDFFSRVPLKNKVLFVWDCDVTYSISETNNTYPFIFRKNESNSIAQKGIENIFPEDLFCEFKKTITLSSGKVITEFDETRKRDLENFVINRNNKADFINFAPLFEKINELKAQS